MNYFLIGFQDELEKQAELFSKGSLKMFKGPIEEAFAAGKLHGLHGGNITNMPAKFQTAIGQKTLPHTQAFHEGVFKGNDKFNSLNKIQQQRINFTGKERTQLAKTRLGNINEIKKTNYINNLKETSNINPHTGVVTPKSGTPTPQLPNNTTPTTAPISNKLGLGGLIQKHPIASVATAGGAGIVAGHVLSGNKEQPQQRAY